MQERGIKDIKIAVKESKSEIGFEKSLSKTSCLMIGIGGLIGGGIFSVIGAISVFTGSYSYLSYLITGIVALFTVYSYSKLNNIWTSPGGEYKQLEMAFSGSHLQNLAPFIGLLLYFGYITTIALYAYTFSVYILYLFNIEQNSFLIDFFITLSIIILIIVNLRGIGGSSKTQNFIVIIYISILVTFITIGIIYAVQQPIQMQINIGLDSGSLGGINFLGIILGSSLILISYEGFQLIAYESREMKNKEDGLKMMKWAIVIAMCIYCLLGFTAMALLGVSEISGENAELSIALAASKVSIVLYYFVVFSALLATSGAINATILGSSRLAYMLAKDKVIPKSLSRISKRKVPALAIITTGLISIILALATGGALAIAGLAGLIFSQVFFIINFTNFKVRERTKSKAIFPIIGMILTAGFFSILIFYSILNIKQEIFSLLSFFIMEVATLAFLHYHSKNTNNDLT